MKKIILPILLLCLNLSALAQAPTNDEPGGAVVAPVFAYGTPCTFSTTTTVNATYSAVPPAPSSPSTCGCASSVPAQPRDVWVQFNSGSFTHFEVQLSAGSFFGTVGYARIYSDISATGTPILCRCAPTSTAPLGNFAFTGLAANTNYYIAFSAKVGTSGFWGPFDYKIIGANSPLPIQLEYMNLKQINEGNLIEWKIQYHENVKSVQLERKNETENEFKAIYETTNINTLAQSFIDQDASIGLNSYRLTSIDLDGKTEHSDVQTITNKSINNISLYPNPSTDAEELKLARKHYTETANIEIYNSNGSLLLSKKIASTNQIISIEETVNFTKGIYIVKYKSNENDYPETIKWVKL